MRPRVTFAELHVVVMPLETAVLHFLPSLLDCSQPMLSEFHMYHEGCKRSVQTSQLVTRSLTWCLLRMLSGAAYASQQWGRCLSCCLTTIPTASPKTSSCATTLWYYARGYT